MKIFISWSGDTSKQLALALKDWIPDVIQSAECFMSSEDIHKGARWFESIGKELEETDFGIVCVTRDNLSSPWLHFEAGALSKKIGNALVVPLLLGLKASELKPPLSLFNAASADAEEIKRVIHAINAKGQQLDDIRLDRAFALNWGRLAGAISGIAKQESAPEPARTSDDMIEEILSVVREMARKPTWPFLDESLSPFGIGMEKDHTVLSAMYRDYRDSIRKGLSHSPRGLLAENDQVDDKHDSSGEHR